MASTCNARAEELTTMGLLPMPGGTREGRKRIPRWQARSFQLPLCDLPESIRQLQRVPAGLSRSPLRRRWRTEASAFKWLEQWTQDTCSIVA